MVSLGLVSAPTWANGGAAGKKRKARSTGGKKKKQRRDGEGWSSEGENEDDDDEADEGDATESPPAPRPPRPKRSQAPKVTASAPGVSSKWATAAREQLQATDLGPAWTALVKLWFTREESHGFVSPRDSHKAKLRPSQVGEWVARARAPRYKPLIPDPAKFGGLWRAWWVDINPGWRRSVEGQLVRMGTGEWEGLDIPGANGFLNVLICLKWWGDAINGTPEAEWDDAVADVNSAADGRVSQLFQLTQKPKLT
ncbi:hypothetical protein GGX14DRAFT_378377 [Mycena pura]|uniref:Uncharacterized protein n=1 Tax=Mycena pura TaxID=153505 RepID=A0AAD6UWS5_9AGAR|nr:hypothetical protein GGX14DRAFT_378377 [Mycena pura]